MIKKIILLGILATGVSGCSRAILRDIACGMDPQNITPSQARNMGYPECACAPKDVCMELIRAKNPNKVNIEVKK